MICKKNKICFIHIPKTGGTTVEYLLFGTSTNVKKKDFTRLAGWDIKLGWLEHLTYNQITEIISYGELSNYFTFTVVRNPWERILSEYFWKKNSTNFELSFRKFIEIIYRKEYNPLVNYYKSSLALHQHLRPQIEYFPNTDEHRLQIIRFENFTDSITKIISKFDLPSKTIPHFRKSNHGFYRRYYCPTTKKMVEELYSDDIIKLEYDY